MARLVCDALRQRRYNVFMDVEDLKSGPFNKALLREIECCTDMVVILTPKSLDRCHNQNDWVRQEIAHAILHKRNIVPVMTRGFSWPESIPDDIATLETFNGLSPSHEYFDAAITKLETLLIAVPQGGTQRNKLFLITSVACAVSGLLGALFVFHHINRSNAHTDSMPQVAVGRLAQSDQQISFRTERLDPYRSSTSPTADDSQRVRKFPPDSDVRELELAFQLRNDTDQLITLSALRLVQLGQVIVYEDDATVIMQLNDMCYQRSVVSERASLGVLELSFPGVTTATCAASDDLLPRDRLESIAPHTVRSFILILRYRGDKRHHSFSREPRFLPGQGLDCLDQNPPKKERVSDIFMLKAQIGYDEKEDSQLYSDRIYLLCLEVGTTLTTENQLRPLRMDEDEELLVPIDSWHTLSPGELAPFVLERAVKLYSETVAYHMAKEKGLVPPGFTAATISPYCYHGDMDSPLRKQIATPGLESAGKTDQGTDTKLLFAMAPTQQRSNLVETFAGIADAHPEVWKLIQKELNFIAGDNSPALALKSSYVLTKLATQSDEMTFLKQFKSNKKKSTSQ